MHTVYGGAHLFRAGTAPRLGELALAALDEHGRDAATFAAAVGVPEALAEAVWQRVRAKLAREPVEDLRIDFEDGYGNRPDDEEDAAAEAAAREVAAGLAAGSLPPYLGIRIKPLGGELTARALRTLERFLRTLAAEVGTAWAGELAARFVVTLPKISDAGQPRRLAETLAALEAELGWPAGSVRCELMIELPQSLFDGDGRLHPPRLVDACDGRCVAAHFGTYDYTAALGITAHHQRMDHPACDFAKQVMQVALAASGVWLSDGATNVMPVAPHRRRDGEPPLSGEQQAENRATVHRAWRLHADHVRHSLVGGFYQGWDLHPAQLPSRYAAVYAFFLAGADAAAERLSSFVERAAQATLVGDVFDDAATGQGLLNFFLRALNCGALEVDEVRRRTGLTLDELRTRSFLAILEGRRATGG